MAYETRKISEMNPSDLVRVKDILSHFRIGTSTLHRWRTKHDFPKPKHCGAGFPYWEAGAIVAWEQRKNKE